MVYIKLSLRDVKFKKLLNYKEDNNRKSHRIR